MFARISSSIENAGLNKITTKTFLRNSQEIVTKAAYYDKKLYYKEWVVKEQGRIKHKYMRSFSNNKLIPKSHVKIDYMA